MIHIELKNISKSFEGKKIVNDIHFRVEKGEMLSLLGPSGEGKTITLKMIAGLLKPDNGDIFFDGVSVLKTPVEKRGAVLVFQDYLLFPHLTVEDNIGFGLKMAGIHKRKRKKVIDEMLQLVKLKGHGSKYPRELSGGQKQRVAFARALAIEPKVLLLDEPFSNLDTTLRESMRDFICEIQRKLQITTISVTHDREEALMISDKIAVLLEGTIKQYGTPPEIYLNPTCTEVAEFFGQKNYIEGVVIKGVLSTAIGEFSIDKVTDGNYRIMIRGDAFKIEKSPHKGVGIIEKVQFAGERIHYSIIYEEQKFHCIDLWGNLFNVGDFVKVIIDFNKAVFFKKD